LTRSEGLSWCKILEGKRNMSAAKSWTIAARSGVPSGKSAGLGLHIALLIAAIDKSKKRAELQAIAV